MARTRTRDKETVHLWLAVAVTIALAVYRIIAAFVSPIYDALKSSLGASAVEWSANVLFMWQLALLWLAYRAWKATIARRLELETVIASIAPDVLLVVNPRRIIVECNDAVQHMFGRSTGEVIGGKTDILYSDRRTSGANHPIAVRLDEVGFHIGEASGHRKDGSVFPLEIVTASLRERRGAIVLIRDVTERKHAEELIIKAKERAEAADAEKGRLLVQLEENYARLKELEELRDGLTHMIVHDLKSPLAAVAGYLELLKLSASSRLEGEEPRFLGEAAAHVEKLTDMIRSLLDVSRLESKQMPIQRERNDLLVLAREAAAVVDAEARRSGVSIEVIGEELPVDCDRDLIGRVIVNLLSNAVHFSPQGGTVRVATLADGNVARLTVSDSGPGIPAEHHGRIFERFGQVEAREHSTGLGLAFCKLAVEAHDGQIGVESPATQPGATEGGPGSTFWFTIPASSPRA